MKPKSSLPLTAGRAMKWPLRHWPAAHQVTLLILILAIVIPISWFPAGKIIFNGDPVAVLDPVRYWLELWSLWQGKLNLGAEFRQSSVYFIHQGIQALPGLFGASDRVTEIFHFTFWFTLPGLTIALFVSALARQLKISQWAVPVAVLFYLFNLYRLANFGDNNHFAIYATIPLLLYWITLVFDEDRPWLLPAIGFALSTLLAAQAGANPPMYTMLVIAVVVYGGVLTLYHWRSWRRSLPFWLVALTGTLLVNLYWLVPFAQSTLRQNASLAAAGNLNWLNDLSKHTSLERVIRLTGAWGWYDSWRGEAYMPYAAAYTRPFWQAITLVPVILAVSWLFFRKGYRAAIFAIFLIGIIGLIFAQGTHPPGGIIFRWAADHLPFFWMFRSPWYKFSNLIALSYAVLAGISLGLLVDWLLAKKQSVLAVLFISLALIAPLIIAHPMISGKMWTHKGETSRLAPFVIDYPEHIRQAATWLNAQPGNTGIALLPYQGATIFKWGFASMSDPITYFSRRPVFFRGDRIGYVPGETPGATIAYRVFKEQLYSGNPSAEQVARLLGIEYIVVRNDIDYTFYDDTDSPTFIKDQIAKMPNIYYVKSFGNWDIYRLDASAANPIYATNWVQTIDGHPIDSLGSILAPKTETDPFPAILYSRPAKQPDSELITAITTSVSRGQAVPKLEVTSGLNHYEVNGQAENPFVLVLNQSMNAGWQLKSHDAGIQGPVIANGYAPAWLVTPTGPFHLTVDFQPQRTLFLLVFISLVSIFVLIGLGIGHRLLRRRGRT